ncbi:hypothetical protein [Hymenobacter metallicola]|uniref:Uncharacterized protein n=1 Tax=Hymenobacter metallicola TaxID=2563114 RepID=A0A4Z0QAQ8_9BACT|nr:hypothetical protein [Hymenobacter metallicola]TGE26546.1 hypothetical protein E5K02_17290 [Hymenobacter metallicola]
MKLTHALLIVSSSALLNCQDKTHEVTSSESKKSNTTILNIDRISSAYNISHSNDLLDTLNNIACNADGEISEHLDVISTKLYRESFQQFIEYLFNNPGSCIENSLIRGTSASLFTEDLENRDTIINDMRNQISKSDKINKEQKKYVISLLSKVNLKSLD